MLDVPSRERLQPSLLDRLVDEVKGIEAEIARVRPLLLDAIGDDPACHDALVALLAPERSAPPGEAELAPFAAKGSTAVELARRLVELEQHRRLELRTRFILTSERLRDCVRRDLTWLFSTDSLCWREARTGGLGPAAGVDIEAFPQAAASVVNYGISPLAGRTGLDPEAVARDLEQAVRAFEPRLKQGTVKVRPAGDAQTLGHALAFDIEAELLADPVPLRLHLRTLIDLESGAASVRPAEAR
jgi:type VI secretion system protein ImpF